MSVSGIPLPNSHLARCRSRITCRWRAGTDTTSSRPGFEYSESAFKPEGINEHTFVGARWRVSH